MKQLAKYRKALVAVAAALTLFVAALADDRVTGDEWWQIVVAVVTALGVWGVPNAPSGDVPPPRL
jgi:hypothetical protein